MQSQLILEIGNHIWHHLPYCSEFLTPYALSYKLSCSYSLFMILLKGNLGKRSGHLLITYSSFLFLWSMQETTSQAKYCVIKECKRVGRAGDEHSMVVLGLRLVTGKRGSLRELFPAHSFFLPKAADMGGHLFFRHNTRTPGTWMQVVGKPLQPYMSR